MNIFTELSYVLAIATGMAFLMRMLKQPLIIGYILTGVIVGPFVLDIVQSTETFETFATLGIILLLFIIGLGLNPKVIKDVGKVSLITGGIQIVGIAILGTLIASSPLIGLDAEASILVGLGMSLSSTIIILKLISDKKEQTRLYGKITIGILMIQDIVATIALVVVSAESGEGLSVSEVESLAIKSILLAVVVYMCGSRILPSLQKTIAGSQEFLFLFALGWGFGVATLFDMIGFSPEVGALFAGMSLATLPYSQDISAKLRPLRDFFIIVFFISLGTHLGINNLGSIVVPALVLSALVLIIKPLIVIALLGLQGYTKKNSFKAGVALAQISEFSLAILVLAKRNNIVSETEISMITLVAIITIAFSTYLMIYSDQIYAWLEARTRLFEHRRLQYEQAGEAYDMILFGYQKGGHEFVKLFKTMGKKYVIVDYNPEVIDKLNREKIPHIFGDANDIELLAEIDLEKTKLVVSTIADFKTNKFIITQFSAVNKKIVSIVLADSAAEAMELYAHGASYVMLPHYIGSEKIGSFIKKNGFNKAEFKKYKDRHISLIEAHMAVIDD